MSYFKLYTTSWEDNHPTHKAKWRADIWDDESNADIVPLVLTPADNPATLSRPNSGDDKTQPSIVGRQLTLRYVFTGAEGEPSASKFFDVNERRFKIELFKNNVLEGVFYVNPGSSKRRYKAPPYEIELTAVDDISFLKGGNWDAYTDTNFIDYRWMSLYEILIQRGVNKIADIPLPVRVINNLTPENISGDGYLLTDLYLHSDMFIDFVKGPDTIDVVVNKVLQAFPFRLFIESNFIYIVRIADSLSAVVSVEEYDITGVPTRKTLPGVRKNVGSSVSAYDAIPVKFDANVINFRATKQLSFNINFKSINVLKNFQWEFFDGSNFEGWDKNIAAFNVDRHGSGTTEDPYTAFLPFVNENSPDDPIYYLSQGSGVTPTIPAKVGASFEVNLKYTFANVTSSYFNLYATDTITGDQIALDASGNWIWNNGNFPPPIPLTRSGKTREGNLSLRTQPIPPRIDTHVLSNNVFQFFFGVRTPVGLIDTDGPIEAGIEFYAIKLGMFTVTGTGREMKAVNTLRVSNDVPLGELYLLDTGSPGLSNTVAVTDTGTAAENWSASPGPVRTLQRYLAQSYVDQYYKAVNAWEGNLFTNSIAFWHIFTFEYLTGLFCIISYTYDIKYCTYDISLQEVYTDRSAQLTYLETDKNNGNTVV